MRDKQLYEDGRCSKVYTRWKSWLSIFDGVYQSAVIFFVAYGVSEVLACLRDDHYLKVTYCLRFRDIFFNGFGTDPVDLKCPAVLGPTRLVQLHSITCMCHV